MNKNNEKQLLGALMSADPPLSTRDLNLLIPDMNERTLRRGLAKMQEQGLLTQEKGGRGYGKGVAYTITTINKGLVAKRQEEHGMASKA